jgi:hypothetical protein
VARAAGLAFGEGAELEVVERVKGNATTEFGAPAIAAEADGRPADPAEAKRLGDLLAAAWTTFDEAVAGAPAELRKGPRGGGRDRDKIREHVEGAVLGYAGKLGLRLKAPDREALRELLSRPSDGGPLKPNGWNARYAARRLAWHLLDHAWEIEDRSNQPGNM